MLLISACLGVDLLVSLPLPLATSHVATAWCGNDDRGGQGRFGFPCSFMSSLSSAVASVGGAGEPVGVVVDALSREVARAKSGRSLLMPESVDCAPLSEFSGSTGRDVATLVW